jgi:selenophosphate synthase
MLSFRPKSHLSAEKHFAINQLTIEVLTKEEIQAQLTANAITKNDLVKSQAILKAARSGNVSFIKFLTEEIEFNERELLCYSQASQENLATIIVESKKLDSEQKCELLHTLNAKVDTVKFITECLNGNKFAASCS